MKYACTKCGAKTPNPGRRCARHERRPWEGSTRRSRLPADWPKIRLRILERDPICQICHEALSTDVDHIQPGDDHSDENLQGACRSCHLSKTAIEANQKRWESNDHACK